MIFHPYRYDAEFWAPPDLPIQEPIAGRSSSLASTLRSMSITPSPVREQPLIVQEPTKDFKHTYYSLTLNFSLANLVVGVLAACLSIISKDLPGDFTTGHILDTWTALLNICGVLYSMIWKKALTRKTLRVWDPNSPSIQETAGLKSFTTFGCGLLLSVILALGAIIQGVQDGGKERAAVLIMIGDLNLAVAATCLLLIRVARKRGRVPHTFTEWCVGTDISLGNTKVNKVHIWIVLSCAIQLLFILLPLPFIISNYIEVIRETGRTVYFGMLARVFKVLTCILGLLGLFHGEEPATQASSSRQSSRLTNSKREEKFIGMYLGGTMANVLFSVCAIVEAAVDIPPGSPKNKWIVVDEGFFLALQALLAIPGLVLWLCTESAIETEATIPLSTPPPVETATDTDTAPVEAVDNCLPPTARGPDEALTYQWSHPPAYEDTLQRESELPPSYAEVIETTVARFQPGFIVLPFSELTFQTRIV
ncbi:uncharacterized protein LOC129591083 [Paramacrobiotus metropolitanus]|uniref:uncharacterized protein LOC129591083 n=1 Tax=Paramacrobiotus metropolitanus TaxID=2943436 RepID=UPI002445CC93|nr:uncharacterized protein LOC129591083 [Paramacrobiotus metropolitanus]